MMRHIHQVGYQQYVCSYQVVSFFLQAKCKRANARTHDKYYARTRRLMITNVIQR